MPNLDQMRRTRERREARENNKAKNEQAAIDQEKSLAALSDRLRGVDGTASTDIGDTDGSLPAPTPKAQQIGKKERDLMKKRAAEEQAERDLQNTVAPKPEGKVDLSKYQNGDIPLHVLNRMAQEADQGIREDAREVAKIVGKAAFEELSGRRPERSRYSRQRKVARVMSEMARTQKDGDK